MPKETALLVERKGDVVSLTLNRPQEGNKVDDAVMDEIITVLGRLNEEQETRLLLLRGAGKDFCRGRKPPSSQGSRLTALQIRDSLRKIVTVNTLLTRLPVITLAAVQGDALGFGAGLATLADLTIAAENARFGFPEIKGALAPTVVLSYLRHWIPRKRALELVVSGTAIDALEAERLGMVNRVVPLERLEQEVEASVSLLLQADRTALRTCKEFLVDTEQTAPADAAVYGIHLLATLLSSS